MQKNKWIDVYAYTVNDYNDIQRMKNLAVDVIFSNYPERWHANQ